MSSDVDAVEYFFTPSTQSCVLATVPVTVAVAVTCTGELTFEPLAGAQMFTPAEVGALQPEVLLVVDTTTSALGAAML